MKKISTCVEILEVNDVTELTLAEQNLVSKAYEAAKNAYAAYSGFHVGCSLLLENNEIITGSNQENIAYPSGLCAERVALFYAGSKFPDIKIKTLVAVAFSKIGNIDNMLSPCGGCRQVMVEYEHRQNQTYNVILGGSNGKFYKIPSAESLMPFTFQTKAILKK